MRPVIWLKSLILGDEKKLVLLTNLECFTPPPLPPPPIFFSKTKNDINLKPHSYFMSHELL